MTNATLAKLTGLQNLDTVTDPTRIEKLMHVARGQQAAYTRRASLRFKVAAAEYAKRAEEMLMACGE